MRISGISSRISFLVSILLVIQISSAQYYLGAVDGWVKYKGNPVEGANVTVKVVGCTPEDAPYCTKNDTTDVNGYYAVAGLDIQAGTEIRVCAYKGDLQGCNTGYGDEYGTATINVSMVNIREIPPEIHWVKYHEYVEQFEYQEILVNVTDNIGVSRVTIIINSTGYNASFNGSLWILRRYEENSGRFCFIVKAYDTDGNEDSSGPYCYEVGDFQSPEYYDYSYKELLAVGDLQVIKVYFRDNMDLNSCWITIDSKRYSATLNLISEKEGYCSFSRYENSPGIFTFKMCANDSSGNYGCYSGKYEVRVELNPPSISIRYDPSNIVYEGEKLTIIAEVTDDSGVASVELHINGMTYDMQRISDNEYSVTLAYQVGSYDFVVYAKDIYGNIASKEGHFTVKERAAREAEVTGAGVAVPTCPRIALLCPEAVGIPKGRCSQIECKVYHEEENLIMKLKIWVNSTNVLAEAPEETPELSAYEEYTIPIKVCVPDGGGNLTVSVGTFTRCVSQEISITAIVRKIGRKVFEVKEEEKEEKKPVERKNVTEKKVEKEIINVTAPEIVTPEKKEVPMKEKVKNGKIPIIVSTFSGASLVGYYMWRRWRIERYEEKEEAHGES